MNKNKIRIGIYAVVVAVLAGLLIFNRIDQSQMTDILNQVGLLLGIAGGGLALGNITPSNVMKVALQTHIENKPLDEPAPWLVQGA